MCGSGGDMGLKNTCLKHYIQPKQMMSVPMYLKGLNNKAVLLQVMQRMIGAMQ